MNPVTVAKNRAQVFNLEVILTLLVITLTIGYTLSSLAQQQQRISEDLEFTRLQQVGKRVGALLAGTTDWECELYTNNIETGPLPLEKISIPPHSVQLLRLPYSIDANSDKLDAVSEENLGIPSGIACRIEVVATTTAEPEFNANGDLPFDPLCASVIDADRTSYSIDRNFIVCNSEDNDLVDTNRLKSTTNTAPDLDVDDVVLRITVQRQQ